MSESKIISWNINGLKSWSETEGVFDFLKKENPDIFCIQETRTSVDKLESEYNNICPEFPFQYYHFGERKGYSGTAIFSKIRPLNIIFGIENSEGEMIDKEGRVITLEYDSFFIINVYTPNSKYNVQTSGADRLDYRVNVWDTSFLNHLKSLKEKEKEIIVCGDMNVLERDIDLQNYEFYFRENPGFRDKVLKERKSFFRFLGLGLVDIYRKLYPDKIAFSWVGPLALSLPSTRLDYFLLSPKIEETTEDVKIINKQNGSDHFPISLILDKKLTKNICIEGESEKICFPAKNEIQNSLF
ncbi:exodeoxyribonuclease III [Patescibacteria group bacterium]|nr:exodeoxyribonuclease III [Patescibacteria group bacterium]